MSRLIKLVVLISFCILAGCSSDEGTEEKSDNVFKAQTDAIEKAEEANAKMLEAAKKQEEEMKKQTGY